MKKSMSKTIGCVFTSSMLALTVGCGNSTETGQSNTAGSSNPEAKESAASDKPIVIKFGHHLADSHSLSEQVVKFADLVKEKSGGQMTVEIFSNGQIGDQRDLLEGLKLGTVNMSMGDAGLVSNYYPAMGILDLPYIFDSMEHAKAALDGEAGKKLKEGVLEVAGFRTLVIEPQSYRHVILGKKEISSFDEFNGLKLRTLQAPQIVETFKSFGSQPVALPTGEAFSAMQTGVVDGLESNAEFLQSIKIWEVGNYMVKTQHNLTNETFNISEQFYQSLSDEQKKIIEDSLQETVDWYFDYTQQKEEEAFKALADNGIKTIDIDVEHFKKTAIPTAEKFVKDNGLEELYQLIQDAKGK